MEIVEINLDCEGEHSFRMFEDEDGKKWFCIADIYECLGVVNRFRHILKNINDNEKRLETIETQTGDKSTYFVSEQVACELIDKSRTKFKDVKALLLDYVDKDGNKRKKKKILKKNKEDKEDTKSDEDVDLNQPLPSPRTTIPSSKINLPKQQKSDKPKTHENSPFFIPEAVAGNPELVKYIIDKQIDKEIEIKKMELEAEKLKVQTHIQAQAHRDAVANKLRYMEHAEFLIKNAMFNKAAPETIAFVNAHAQASMKMLQDNFDTEFKMNRLPGPEHSEDLKYLSAAGRERYLKEKNDEMMKHYLGV